MALKARIYKAGINVADMNRHYYADHDLTIARHPSENDERAMLRLMVWLLHASGELQFTKGISTDDEPDIWQKNLSGEIETWIELGQPDEKRIRKACGRAKKVYIYNYGGRSSDIWWQQYHDKVQRFDNLYIYRIPAEGNELVRLIDKTMKLHCIIQDQQVTIGNNADSITVEISQRFPD
ncbi:YaeQ family protein [Endozoicomonas sp. SESOKO1]|uniref:YaeQ family protein n=1 Tax=Endozoicomonas sp. SESOKO1 TaxID=2828742 RepID=UPI0021487A41|nr:YaeQ family protein [Endozoicomonas sp. SESOKO1]